MNFLDAKEKLSQVLNDPILLSLLEDEFGEVEEVFVASSDFLEMFSDFELIKENEFDVGEELLTCKRLDYALYVMTLDADLEKIPDDFF